MLYSGVDLHRRLIVICTVDDSGKVLARKSMKTQPELITDYFRQWPDEIGPLSNAPLAGIGSATSYAPSASASCWLTQSA